LKTVLLVEDCESLRKLLSDFIASMNMHVLEASGTSESVFIVNRWPDAIDLLITDINLDKESGWECAAEIAKLKPSCQVLFMSGSLDARGWKRHWQKPDGSHFIQKPFRLSELATLISAIFGEQTIDSINGPSTHTTEKSAEERR
jgi:DNA-binding NtrC family response regulator